MEYVEIHRTCEWCPLFKYLRDFPKGPVPLYDELFNHCFYYYVLPTLYGGATSYSVFVQNLFVPWGKLT
jgi:hypothetical protein